MPIQVYILGWKASKPFSLTSTSLSGAPRPSHFQNHFALIYVHLRIIRLSCCERLLRAPDSDCVRSTMFWSLLLSNMKRQPEREASRGTTTNDKKGDTGNSEKDSGNHALLPAMIFNEGARINNSSEHSTYILHRIVP